MKKRSTQTALMTIISVLLAAGCTTKLDEDAFRAGAIRLELNEVTSDELYPTAGDEIDWKMIFVPTPGDIIVNTFWDHPFEIFNVEIGVYDRFGIPIKVQRRDSGGATGELRTFVPESGLHYIKLSAESGRSIYSINVKFESNNEGFIAPTTAPSFEAYLDFDAQTGQSASGSGGAAASGGSGSGGGGAAGGGGSSGGGGAASGGGAAGGGGAAAGGGGGG
ncbi:MAG: hypothetical protein FWC40_05935, partial [Proteobacteria bacterium]|nr:hypothetical protein [Pseudomonadota bacterium]